jgi:hypothetical protein
MALNWGFLLNVKRFTVVFFAIFRAISVLEALCRSYAAGDASGDLCNRLCFDLHKWTVLDLYEGNKIVISLRGGGQEMVLKSQHAMLNQFEELDARIDEDDFTDKVR